MTTILLLLIATQAHAGKLADGFRGLPFGPDTVLTESPIDGCVPDAEAGVRWQCATEIGGVPVTVNYFHEYDLFYSLSIVAKGGYQDAIKLRAVFGQAYGRGSASKSYGKGGLDAWSWRDGSVMAGWEWNKYSGEARFTVFDLTLYREKGRREDAAAAESMGDL